MIAMMKEQLSKELVFVYIALISKKDYLQSLTKKTTSLRLY